MSACFKYCCGKQGGGHNGGGRNNRYMQFTGLPTKFKEKTIKSDIGLKPISDIT